MVQDISKFLVLFFIVFVAFAMAIRKAYSQYVEIVDTYKVPLEGPGGHTFSRSVQGGGEHLPWNSVEGHSFSVELFSLLSFQYVTQG